MAMEFECPGCGAVLELAARVLKPAKGKGSRRSAAGRYGLTAREALIADRIVDGCSNGDIAAELKMGLQTVKNSLCMIFCKIGCGSRAELVSMVLLGTERPR